MSVKTYNPAEVGIHVFERAGLGLAPFRFFRFSVMKFQACQGAPVQPGTCCDYCGTGIMNVCHIRAADGKEFKVGCDCVAKTDDAGLIKAYKQSAEFRQHQRVLRHEQDKARIQDLTALLDKPEVQAVLKQDKHPSDWYASKGKTFLDYALYVLKAGGARGRADILKGVRRRLDGSK